MRISDWSSDVCSSDLGVYSQSQEEAVYHAFTRATGIEITRKVYAGGLDDLRGQVASRSGIWDVVDVEPVDAEEGCKEGLLMELGRDLLNLPTAPDGRSEEHTSELQSLMRISYAVFRLKKKNKPHDTPNNTLTIPHT